jgi:hypothetical protein
MFEVESTEEKLGQTTWGIFVFLRSDDGVLI